MQPRSDREYVSWKTHWSAQLDRRLVTFFTVAAGAILFLFVALLVARYAIERSNFLGAAGPTIDTYFLRYLGVAIGLYLALVAPALALIVLYAKAWWRINAFADLPLARAIGIPRTHIVQLNYVFGETFRAHLGRDLWIILGLLVFGLLLNDVVVFGGPPLGVAGTAIGTAVVLGLSGSSALQDAFAAVGRDRQRPITKTFERYRTYAGIQIVGAFLQAAAGIWGLMAVEAAIGDVATPTYVRVVQSIINELVDGGVPPASANVVFLVPTITLSAFVADGVRWILPTTFFALVGLVGSLMVPVQIRRSPRVLLTTLEQVGMAMAISFTLPEALRVLFLLPATWWDHPLVFVLSWLCTRIAWAVFSVRQRRA